jgi:hypothetical protein
MFLLPKILGIYIRTTVSYYFSLAEVEKAYISLAHEVVEYVFLIL